ncbi:hypothetical protein SISSUDRAFT_388240 [Sistotremastrum suecicum HHB10207 ss-3]|uniref:Uncharacterized protein n=1 Tax=Sistotremastrum suecicum HHB10207 ss-3 TaxID=1314776 RepID=A0A166FWH5_9AGAM|nr:hypothetical protein SISSUDRAFT_388240 [Sistotremastrum suecicum HHB10207 ss-3]
MIFAVTVVLLYGFMFIVWDNRSSRSSSVAYHLVSLLQVLFISQHLMYILNAGTSSEQFYWKQRLNLVWRLRDGSVILYLEAKAQRYSVAVCLTDSTLVALSGSLLWIRETSSISEIRMNAFILRRRVSAQERIGICLVEFRSCFRGHWVAHSRCHTQFPSAPFRPVYTQE